MSTVLTIKRESAALDRKRTARAEELKHHRCSQVTCFFFFQAGKLQTGRSLQPEMLRAEEASQRSHSFNVSPEQGVYLCYRANQLLIVKEEDFYFGRLSGLNQCLKLRF